MTMTDSCATCEGCGQVADTPDREPWTAWLGLPAGSNAAVALGVVQPIPCEDCGGSGKRLDGGRPRGEADSEDASSVDDVIEEWRREVAELTRERDELTGKLAAAMSERLDAVLKVDALIRERDEALAHIERLSRVGICGSQAPAFAGSMTICALRHGHKGWHEAEGGRPKWTEGSAPGRPVAQEAAPQQPCPEHPDRPCMNCWACATGVAQEAGEPPRAARVWQKGDPEPTSDVTVERTDGEWFVPTEDGWEHVGCDCRCRRWEELWPVNWPADREPCVLTEVIEDGDSNA